MKRISNKVNRAYNEGPRKARNRIEKVKSLNITSLVDILTILLVFLIKNVSIDAQRVTIPEKMNLPATFITEELERSGMSVILKVFPDQILVGTDNILVGTPEDFMTNQEVRSQLLYYMREQADLIVIQNPDLSPLLLLQADSGIYCRYITDIVALGATAGFSNIYFSTIKVDDPQFLYGL
ncbi:MAG: biopolymer transporter ExbD [Candidatus Cloacimonetes bacterium]|nr:biopolymer transporter ExbD [Candidatus Cloacimonadota bacterium]